MKEWILSEVCSYILSQKLSYLGKIKIRIKLRKAKKALKKLIEKNILLVYGNEVFYHDYDCFLQEKKFIHRILKDLSNTGMKEYKSVEFYVKILVKEFVDKFPQYVIYKTTFEKIIFMIFKCIFDSLNKCDDENVRIIINNTKEIVGELDIQIQNLTEQGEVLHKDHERIFKMLSEMRKNPVNYDLSIDSEKLQIGLKLYKESLHELYWNKSGYIKRVVKDEKGSSIVDVLVRYKKLILLGEPGCGKTTEALIALEMICNNDDFKDLIPIYISLAEYGILYENIRKGIQEKLDLFIPNIQLSLVNQMIDSGKVILFLDGADEITPIEERNKFYFDINNIMRLSDIYVLLTSRRNQYHGNAKNIKEISICNIDKATITQQLSKAGIYGNVADEFYELFQYPLFLEIGISVLQLNSGTIFNKSQLVEEYINSLFSSRDKEKGITIDEKRNLNEIVSVISKLAFSHFNKSSFSFLEFDSILMGTDFSHTNICDMFRLDIFSIGNDVRFSHKQFKEFFSAFYLVNNISILDNIEKYREIMHREEWQEVLVFACGLYSNLEEQNCFLDELIKVNLRTYIRCIRLKNDLSSCFNTYSHEEYSNYYLETLYKSYMTIVNTYFPNLKDYFNPQKGKKQEISHKMKPCIVGEISKDKKHLSYWFDWKDEEEANVQILEGNGREVFKDLEKRAILERRNISTFGLNLVRAGYEGDSARIVAVKRIKEDIENILKKRELIETDAILCERLMEIKKKVKFIKDSKSVKEMFSVVKNYVDEIFTEHADREGELIGIEYNNVDMVNLLDILQKLYSHNASYEELIMPGPDINLNGGLIWDFYSKEQMVKVIRKFFSEIVTSYQSIIENNFPLMSNYFNMSQDYPLKYKIRICFKDKEGFNSQPSIAYYYVATSNGDIEPEVTVVDEKDIHFSEDIFSEIASSYINNGREARGMSVTNTGITMCINEDYGKYRNCPLASYIYKHIEKEFKQMFDK